MLHCVALRAAVSTVQQPQYAGAPSQVLAATHPYSQSLGATAVTPATAVLVAAAAVAATVVLVAAAGA